MHILSAAYAECQKYAYYGECCYDKGRGIQNSAATIFGIENFFGYNGRTDGRMALQFRRLSFPTLAPPSANFLRQFLKRF
jgi:hypothetical protein